PCRTVELPPVRQLAGSIDGLVAVLRPPRSQRIVVLQPESERIHARVAGGAHRVLPVLLHLLAERAGQPPFRPQFGHVGRGRGRRASLNWGKRRRSGRKLARSRKVSHWSAKLSTTACDFGSFSIRRASASSTPGLRRDRFAAIAKSRSSGILLQTK